MIADSIISLSTFEKTGDFLTSSKILDKISPKLDEDVGIVDKFEDVDVLMLKKLCFRLGFKFKINAR